MVGSERRVCVVTTKVLIKSLLQNLTCSGPDATYRVGAATADGEKKEQGQFGWEWWASSSKVKRQMRISPSKSVGKKNNSIYRKKACLPKTAFFRSYLFTSKR
eukprot:TRINITY_DN14135_c0_g1_i1.p1 TRINITY_DN14135_c0_g1~~TRINITY_DN14135_c0_g1_i1.p1  ORF type:complete len:103 (-),score=6.45 TRINITY_DN14135_c0_g1_i1:731-1039(-)